MVKRKHYFSLWRDNGPEKMWMESLCRGVRYLGLELLWRVEAIETEG